jgi:hypothetical protein
MFKRKSLSKLPNIHTKFDQLIHNYRLRFKEKLKSIQAAIEQQNWAKMTSLMH